MAYTFKHGDRPLADFTIQRAVGRGGFGEVYYAVSDGGREVALKYLHDNPQVELRGVSHCMNLKSPNLVSIFDVKKNAGGEYFVIMEYISGPSLRDLLVAEPAGLGTDRAVHIAHGIAQGLSYLHDRGIVHRDLKPGNIFIDEGRVKIGDYGLSKFIAVSRHSVQTASVGTVHYMAPEVGSGDYSRTIDIYAFGVILYEMLLGKVPFSGASMGEILMKHLTAQPEVDALPAPFGEVIRKALAKEPSERFQTVEAMMAPIEAEGRYRHVLSKESAVSLAGSWQLTVAFTRPEPARPPRVPGGAVARTISTGAPAAAAWHGGAAADMAIPRTAPSPVRTAATSLSPEAAAGALNYAGFWIRVLAALIDGVIVSFGVSLLARNFPPLNGLAMIVYQGIMVGMWNGQTLGKKVCGLRVIREDGHMCGVGQAFGRAAAKLLSAATLTIGYLMVAFTERNRGLHDMVASTLVVYAVDDNG